MFNLKHLITSILEKNRHDEPGVTEEETILATPIPFYMYVCYFTNISQTLKVEIELGVRQD